MENIRLKTVCTFIEKDDILADIGCDHGYLGFMALDKGVHFVQFIDNKQGPLDQAIKNSANYDQSKMLFTKSSGLNNLDYNINTICICGVGGELIIEMLEDDFEKAKRLKKLILQPNRNVDNLRDYLFKNGFKILDEEVVFGYSDVG